MKKLIVFFFALTSAIHLFAQEDADYEELGGREINTITTAVPFLTIVPDARGASMGDAGVSTTPDANSIYYNAAKYAFAEKKVGFSLSYTPWLRELVDDINLAYLSGYYKFDNNQAMAVSLRYFSLGEVIFRDNADDPGFPVSPNEFSVAATYSRKLSENLSGAVTARYIRSDLTQGQFAQGRETQAGNSIAADIGVYWQKEVDMFDVDSKIAWGIAITNIGQKISYSVSNIEKDFIPTNLKFGPSFTFNIDEYNQISVALDINKLLVLTTPWYWPDSTDPATGKPAIRKGYDPDVSVIRGIIQSFYDAPDGFSEEIKEFSYSFGAEYWYNQQFSIRTGFFYEDKSKGNRKYFTVGAGVRYNVFGLDFAYLVPVGQLATSPLDDTLRFTLHFDFDAFNKQN